MKFSEFGQRFAGASGIVELMDDLGSALNENPQMIFMGGGNPARIPEVESVFKQRLQSIIDDPQQLHTLTGIYQSPQGDRGFLRDIAQLLKRQLGREVTEHNVAVSNGSQPAFFVLYNMLAGYMSDGGYRSVHLPLTPEYIGYSDLGLSANMFTSTRPEIEFLDDDLFKYRVDFNNLRVNEDTAALCVSRPTNPTGNVLTDNEVEHLDSIAETGGVPFIIDGAYGLPFPGILFNHAKPHWNSNTILVLSLSKLGLPGVRTGVVVANEEVIQAFRNANTVLSLACGNLGPMLVRELIRTDELVALGSSVIRPFYRERAQQTVDWIRGALRDIPLRIHKPEGAIFLWLWFEGLPITSQELYLRLKKRGVLVVPGHNFFPGMDNGWRHQQECIRISYAQDPDIIKAGVHLIAEEVIKAYRE